MKDFMRVLGLAKRHSAWILLSLISMVVVAGATVFAFNLLRPICDEFLQPGQQSHVVADATARGMVAALDRVTLRARGILQSWFGATTAVILILAVIAMVAKNFFGFLARFASARFGLATIRDLRALFYQSLLAQSPAFFHDRSTAALVSRATNDLQLLREALAERFGDVAQDLLVVPVVVVYLLSLDLHMTIVTLVAAPLLFAPVVYLSRRLRDRARLAQKKTADVAVVIDETIRGVRAVQNFGMSRYLLDRFNRANRDQYLANLAARALQAANAPVMEVVGVGAAMAVVAYAAMQISAEILTIGGFSAFVVGAYALYNPFKRINKFNLVAQQAVVAASRVFEIIDAPVAVREPPNPRPLAVPPRDVRFENVDFSYRPNQRVLQDFNLDIQDGSTVALVGASGVGKSTAAQLIPRFMDVDAGAVRLGDFDVRELELKNLRTQVGLVTQETHLFNDTVRTNITCGRFGIGDDVLDAAVQVADAASLIDSLPDRYETVIGENGVVLSGGQRQRLAIARAILADPSILILDEATSAIDPESEDRIYRALLRRDGRRTTLVIAHRLATIRRADTVAVLSNGRIVEIGSHDALIETGGLYQSLVHAQELI